MQNLVRDLASQLNNSIVKSLRGKVVLFAAGMCLATAALVGAVADRTLRQATVDAAIDSLGAEARLMGERFRSQYKVMETNALVVSRTPPIQGLMRSLANGDVDPYDGSTTELWRTRLETIFISIMAEAPHLTQMRYISASGQAPELVRVNRVGDGFERVPPTALQNKGAEPYVAAARSLSAEEAFFSSVTLNREHGVVEAASRPQLRVVAPVFGPRGALYGMIVLNADFELVLERAFELIAPSRETYVVESSYGYMVARPGEAPHLEPFEAGGSAKLLKMLGLQGNSETGANVGVSQGFGSYRAVIEPPNAASASELSVIIRRPLSELLAPSYAARWTTLTLIFALTALSAFAAAFFAGRLALPLKSIAQRLAQPTQAVEEPGLPTEREDEIGHVARAFAAKAAALASSEKRAQVVLDTATDGILTVDEHGVIQSFNRACERLFGYSANDVIGENVAILTTPANARAHVDQIQRGLLSGDAEIIGAERELTGRRRDGALLPLEVSVAEATVDGRKLFTGILRDISGRKALEAETDRLIKRLEESNAELESFAYIASHDLKAPLRAIDSTATWLTEDLGDALEGENFEHMEMLRSRVRRMNKLLDDLLEFSRIGRKIDQRYTEKVDGETLMEDVLALQNPPKDFDIAIDPSFKKIMVDRMPLQQILQNLVSNAVKHHDRPDGRVTIDVKDLGEAYAISVKDDGPGIPKQFHEQIFAMFQTLKPRDRVEGSGMGLAVVRKLVAMQRGSIRLESEEGCGAAFHIHWPKAPKTGDGRVDATGA